ncbi:MAG: T9SS type A sorting domain-containing protein [Crocinitomicaceae bacterium]
MKAYFKLILVSLLFPLFSTAQVTSFSVGDTVGIVQVTDMSGTFHDLKSIAQSGKYIMVNVFDVDGSSSQNSFQYFNQLYEKYGCNGGDLFCISVNNGSDTDDGAITNFVASYGGTSSQAPVVNATEGEAVKNYFGISNYPTFFLIGSDNKLKDDDIWPVASVEDLEYGFSTGFEPAPMNCTSAIVENDDLLAQAPYPNPANNFLNIEIDNAAADVTNVSLHNNLGQQVKSFSVVGKTIYQLGLHDIAAGIYHLRLTSDDKSVTYRIEVQH